MTGTLWHCWLDVAPGTSARAAARIRDTYAEETASLVLHCEIGPVNTILWLSDRGSDPLAALRADKEIAPTIRSAVSGLMPMPGDTWTDTLARLRQKGAALVCRVPGQGRETLRLLRPPSELGLGDTLAPVSDFDEGVALALTNCDPEDGLAPSLFRVVAR